MNSKISNKFLIIFIIFSTRISTAQTNGLAVDLQYEQRIQDARYQNQQLNKAYAERYNKLKDDYIYALGLNAIKDKPKELSNSGSYDVIITNGGQLFEKTEVFILNNKVISISAPNDKIITPKSSSVVQNFRCIVVMPNDAYLEVIFTDLFN